MKKYTLFERLQPVLLITGLLLLQLSCHSMLFAAQVNNIRLPMMKHTAPIRITHGPTVYTTAEGEEHIANSNGSIID